MKYTHSAKQNFIEQFLLSNSKKIAITSILFILAFFIFSPLSQDDIEYFALQNTSLNWLYDRYNNWSSRVVIESILPFLTNNEYVFKFLNVVIFLSTPVAVYLLSDRYRLTPVFCLLAVAIFPFYKLTSAGYAATVTNYFYPIAFALWIVVYIFARKANILGYIVLTLLCIFASNMEQTAILLFFISLYSLFIKTSDKKLSLITIIISLLGIYFMFKCPGNEVRLISETKTWFEGYELYTLKDKIELGIASSLYFLNYKGPVAFLLCFSICVLAITRKLSYSLIITLILTLLINTYLRNTIGNKAISLDANWINNIDIKSVYLTLFMPVALILSIFYINISVQDKITIILLIAIAYALRCSMGFSPTVFASNERPSLVSHMIFIFASLYIILKNNIDKRKALTIFIIFGMYSSFNSLFRAVRAIHHSIFM